MDLCLPLEEFVGSDLVARSSRCVTRSTFSCPWRHSSIMKEAVMPTKSEAEILDIDSVKAAQVIISQGGRQAGETALGAATVEEAVRGLTSGLAGPSARPRRQGRTRAAGPGRTRRRRTGSG
jgi:hypothetical protein